MKLFRHDTFQLRSSSFTKLLQCICHWCDTTHQFCFGIIHSTSKTTCFIGQRFCVRHLTPYSISQWFGHCSCSTLKKWCYIRTNFFKRFTSLWFGFWNADIFELTIEVIKLIHIPSILTTEILLKRITFHSHNSNLL